ncbi:MAG: Ig-like domain-containing protein [Coprococcus sp.]
MKKVIKFLIIFIFCIFALSTTVVHAAEINSKRTGADTSEDTDEDAIHILFIGNSFTSTSEKNNIGKILENIAESQGISIKAETITNGGAHLSYYASPSSTYASYYKDVQLALLTEKWDYIVLQEYSKGGIECADTAMLPAIETLQQLIGIYQPDAEILLYMTHGYDNGVTTSVNGKNILLTKTQLQQYTQAAYTYIGNKLGLRVVPVGMAFSRCEQLYPDISLISSDDKHPDYAGYFLAACCFYKTIFDDIPRNTENIPKDCQLTRDVVEQLYNTADGSLHLNKSSRIMKAGQTYQLKATFNNTSDTIITWKSLSPSIVTIDSTGNLTAKKTGTALIIARSESGLQDICYITVEDESLNKKGLVFATESYVVEKGDHIRITPSYSATLTNSTIVWYSSRKSIASVASDGTVTAVAPGKAVIKATDSQTGKSATYTLFVRFPAPKEVSAQTITASANKANEANIKISWSSVANADTYTVYRSSSKNGTYMEIGKTSSCNFIDTKVRTAKKYYYKVSAGNGYISCESSKSSAYARVIAPTTPDISKVSATNAKIKITWTRRTSASGYIIYRSTDNGKTYKKVAQKTSNRQTSYIDKNVKSNKTYCYKVKAYRQIGESVYNSNFSDPVKIRTSKKNKEKNTTKNGSDKTSEADN